MRVCTMQAEEILIKKSRLFLLRKLALYPFAVFSIILTR